MEDKFVKYHELLYNEILNTLKNFNFTTKIYALVLELFYGEEYGVRLRYNSIDDYNEIKNHEKNYVKFDCHEFQTINLDESCFFKSNIELSQFFGSIIYYAYTYPYEIDNYLLEEFVGLSKIALLQKENLPKNHFEFLEESLIFCAKKLKTETDFIEKDSDFLIYVAHDNTMYYRYEFVTETVEGKDLHLFDDLIK